MQRLFSLFFDILSINVRWESILIFRWNGKNQFYLTCSLTRWLIDQCPFVWLSFQRTLQLFTVHRNCTVAIRVLGHRFIRPIERKRKRRFFFVFISVSFAQFPRCVLYYCCRSLPYDIMCRMFYLLLNIPAYYGETKSLFASGSLCCACPQFYLLSHTILYTMVHCVALYLMST